MPLLLADMREPSTICDADSTQLLKILDFRNDESVRKGAANTQEILEATKRESETLTIIAQRTRVDSRSMKIMTFVAIAYLPANLAAVGFLIPSLCPLRRLLCFRESSAQLFFRMATATTWGLRFILAITS